MYLSNPTGHPYLPSYLMIPDVEDGILSRIRYFDLRTVAGVSQSFAMTLLTKEECKRFLSLYDQALSTRIDQHRSKAGGKDLLDLDRWRLSTLSQSIRSRKPSFMTKPELEKLMDCKLYSPHHVAYSI